MPTVQSDFYVPKDDILCELGRVQVLHSQLDYTLRLAIKRMLEISIEDPGYWNETKGMSQELRDRARELIDERYHDDENTADTLKAVLAAAEEATKDRNIALHAAWMQVPGEEPVLYDRDKTTRQHVRYQPPTIDGLKNLCKRIESAQRTLNHITRQLLNAGER